MDASLKAADNIWNEGLLKKGFGICHGVTGNAYPFLNLYAHSGNEKYLYRAYKFICVKSDRDKMQTILAYDHPDRFVRGSTDNPYSLMMGLSGDLSMMMDSFDP